MLIVEYKERYTFRYVILLDSPFARTGQSSPVERGNPNIFMMQKPSNRITLGFFSEVRHEDHIATPLIRGIFVGQLHGMLPTRVQ